MNDTAQTRLRAGFELIDGALETAADAIDRVEDDIARQRLRHSWERLNRARRMAHTMLERLDGETGDAADLLSREVEREIHQLDAEVALLNSELRSELATTVDDYRAAAREQLLAWRSRLDELRVQAALARMEIRDDVDAALDRMEGHYHDAAHHLHTAGPQTVLAALRQKVRRLLGDVRDAAAAASDGLAGGPQS